jgi:hypothetical protein
MTMTGVIPDYYRGFKPHLSNGAPVYLSGLNTRALAESNPSRSGDLDLAVSIGELRDLPGMLRDAHGLLTNKLNPKKVHGSVGSAYLAGKFGWAPIIKDIIALLDLQDAIEERFQEIRNHSTNPKGYRRTVTLGTSTKTEMNEGKFVAGYSIGSLHGKEVVTTIDRKWAQVVYKPTTSVPFTSAQMRKVARRAVSGTRVDASTAWNLLPWSWMVDWFANVGDVLQASRNDCGYYADSVLIMHSIETTYSLNDVAPGPGQTGAQIHFVTGGDGMYRHVERHRYPMTPNYLPTIEVPVLTGSQMSILGALGIQQLAR